MEKGKGKLKMMGAHAQGDRRAWKRVSAFFGPCRHMAKTPRNSLHYVKHIARRAVVTSQRLLLHTRAQPRNTPSMNQYIERNENK